MLKDETDGELITRRRKHPVMGQLLGRGFHETKKPRTGMTPGGAALNKASGNSQASFFVSSGFFSSVFFSSVFFSSGLAESAGFSDESLAVASAGISKAAVPAGLISVVVVKLKSRVSPLRSKEPDLVNSYL